MTIHFGSTRPTQPKDGDQQRRKELPLGLTEPGHLLQNLVDNFISHAPVRVRVGLDNHI